jgi:2-polyprenyl-3-methyl-5-hydroxy-6-metoxy-1,4-benzoquinol methylase
MNHNFGNVCLICKREGTLIYDNLFDFLVFDKGRWKMYYCQNDELAWLWPQPSKEDINKLYSNYHTHKVTQERVLIPQIIKEYVLTKTYDYPMSNRVKNNIKWLRLVPIPPFIKEMVGSQILWLKYQPGGNLLDVGCGNGAYLNQMKKLGWSIQGIEPDPDAARVGIEYFGLPIKIGELTELNLRPCSFDVIILKHVIEHVSDPVLLLQECYRLAKGNGRLIIATPNFNSLGHKIFKHNWSILEPPRHLYLFTNKSLTYLIKNAGFKIVTSFTFPRGARVMFDLSKILLLEKNLYRHKNKYDHPLKIGGLLFFLLEYFINKLKKGLGEELVIIAKKYKLE